MLVSVHVYHLWVSMSFSKPGFWFHLPLYCWQLLVLRQLSENKSLESANVGAILVSHVVQSAARKGVDCRHYPVVSFPSPLDRLSTKGWTSLTRPLNVRVVRTRLIERSGIDLVSKTWKRVCRGRVVIDWSIRTRSNNEQNQVYIGMREIDR